MYYYSTNFKSDALFESCGHFISSEPWRHSSRVITSYELMFGIEGTLPIEVGNQRYELKANEFLIIPPGVPHTGYRFTEGPVHFLWIHFTHEQFLAASKSDIEGMLEKNENNHSFCVFPVYYGQMDMHRILLMGNQLLDIYQEHAPQEYLNCFLNSLLHEINFQVLRLLKQSQINHNNLQPIQDYIRIHAFEPITLPEIAAYFNYNKNYLSRKYKDIIGMGISQQITKFRIEEAKVLLSTTNLSIQEIASTIGYDDAKYFMRIFKKIENNTPSEYRNAFSQKHFNNK